MLIDIQTQSNEFLPTSLEFASEPLSPWAQKLGRIKEHLLFGTSHMIPFIVAGGVLLSLSVMISGHGGVPQEGILADIAQMGIAGLTLFTAVLGGYIAYSIADKPGLAPVLPHQSRFLVQNAQHRLARHITLNGLRHQY